MQRLSVGCVSTSCRRLCCRKTRFLDAYLPFNFNRLIPPCVAPDRAGFRSERATCKAVALTTAYLVVDETCSDRSSLSRSDALSSARTRAEDLLFPPPASALLRSDLHVTLQVSRLTTECCACCGQARPGPGLQRSDRLGRTSQSLHSPLGPLAACPRTLSSGLEITRLRGL